MSAFRRALSAPDLGINILWFLAFEIAFYVAYRYGMLFSRTLGSPFWFPDSVLLCALLKTRPRNWWIFILGTLPIRLFSPVAAALPLWFLIATFALDSVKMAAAAWLLRRLMRNCTKFETLRDFVLFAAIAVFGMPALSAFGGAALRSMAGHNYWQSWQTWFLGEALTHLIVTPAILYLVFDAANLRRYFNIARAAEAAILLVGLLATGYLATHVPLTSVVVDETALYAPVPFLFWAAIRFGVAGASGGLLIITLFAVEAALNGHGPYRGVAPSDIAFALQSFLLLRSVPLYLVAVAIEQERTAERSLRASEELFRKLAESAPIMIWMSGPDKLCTYFNHRWLEFTGLGMQQAVGTGWMDAIHPDDRAHCIEQYSAAFDARQPIQADFRLRRHDGEYRWIGDYGVPRYGPDGDFAGYIGSGIDITDRKRAEEEHRALAHAQRLAIIGELTAGVAHEMRQPLAALAIDAETLKMMLNDGTPQLQPLREIASDMVWNVRRTDDVIKLISTFVRKPETMAEPIAPEAMVSDVLQLAGKDATRRRVEIRTELTPGLPAVMGDRTQLQQLLLNLVINAIDAMQSVAEPERLLILRSARNAEGGVEISISDSGPGIPPEQMERLFESFFTTKPDGMGLGLSIARSIALAHGGQIHVEGNVPRGTTFRVAFPAATEAQGIAKPAGEPNTAAGSVEGMLSSV